MLDNEPNSGADGTAGTTETTAGATANTGEPEIRVSAPTRSAGARRAAGPPPEPEPAASAPARPLTSPAGEVEPEAAVSVAVGRPSGRGAGARRAAAAPPEPAAGPPETGGADAAAGESAEEGGAPAKTRSRRSAAAKGTSPTADTADTADSTGGTAAGSTGSGAAEEAPAERPRRSRRRTAARAEEPAAPAAGSADAPADDGEPAAEANGTGAFQAPMVLFQPPVAQPAAAQRPAGPPPEVPDDAVAGNGTEGAGTAGADHAADSDDSDDGEDDTDAEGDDRPARRRRRRGGRGRGKARGGEAAAEDEPATDDGSDADAGEGDSGEGGSRRRRRRRRRTGGDESAPAKDDPPNTVVKVREPRPEKPAENEVQAVRGSTRLEAKKQRRREGREQGRRRTPIVTESEFLARREAVKRDLVIRSIGDRTQIGVLEDDVLVEHYVDRAQHRSYVGNVYLGRVQNVLPSMEAAFVDIGKGRNAVLYAGEVNWDASGVEGQPKRIESVLKSGQSVLVQVTKDPLGHKGARLTSQVSLPGRYLVYVPDGSMTGISRKLPDKERSRLKQILKKVMPANAGVIVRTAAEGASEEELERDIKRLSSQWESIKRKSKSSTAPALLSSEPDLTVKVVRDVFNEDFSSLVVQGGEAWDTVKEYVDYVAPQLAERLTHWDGERDVFEAYRIDEQIGKGLDRKVWLPSGGSLVIDRTEAMTVVDVNTGKFTGQGGNLEETVTKNNLEAAEEIVRQLRLRDIGGIIVIDFIDMVLESNRDLVLRRLLECLSRDRTKHQVAEVTSLGLVQMTRKRVGQGLLEAFSHTCEHCGGRGLIVSSEPVENKGSGDGGGRKKKGKGDKPADKGADKAEKADKPAAKDAKDSSAAPEAADEQPSGRRSRKKKAAAEDAAPQEAAAAETAEGAAGAAEAPAEEKKAPAKRTRTRKSAAKAAAGSEAEAGSESGAAGDAGAEPAEDGAAAAPARSRKRSSRAAAAADTAEAAGTAGTAETAGAEAGGASAEADAPEEAPAPRAKRSRRATRPASAPADSEPAADAAAEDGAGSAEGDGAEDDGAERPRRRRTRRKAAAADTAGPAAVDAG